MKELEDSLAARIKMAIAIEDEHECFNRKLKELGKVPPKFEWYQKVYCAFRGKPTIGTVISKKGHYYRDDIHKYENKYMVEVPESKHHQLKWEHELSPAQAILRKE